MTLPLTSEQATILALVARGGMTYAEIAAVLECSPHTVRAQVAHIRVRLGLRRNRRRLRSLVWELAR